jgi:hypothetical protein
MIEDNLKVLIDNKKLTKEICVWGVSNRTCGILDVLQANDYKVVAVIDSFKSTYKKEFHGIPLVSAEDAFKLENRSQTLLILGNYTDAIIRQSKFLPFEKVYNLEDLQWKRSKDGLDIATHFTNRSKGKENLVYILAGYQDDIWESTIARIEHYQSDKFDYCICSSGVYSEELASIAERNQWSYIYTEKNQVSYIQNQVIRLHPKAKYILKMDEDIVIAKNFFEDMLAGYRWLEESADSRIGFVVPVIPLNCAGYVSFLHTMGKEEEYEKRFGKIYRSRFSAYMELDMAPFLWDMIDDFDEVAARFAKRDCMEIQELSCYYNISCIMFSRERWHMMGLWPVDNESGMGNDEMYICQDNNEKDLAIFELGNVLAGHFSFGPQRAVMSDYYERNRRKFIPHRV